MLEAPYASASQIAIEALGLFLPPERLNTAEYAIRNRLLENSGGGHVGQYSAEIAPYVVQPQQCLDSLEHLTVAVVGPGQVGKTVIAENWLQKSVEADPADLLWYMQDQAALESYVKGRINPMIRLHDGMQRKLGRRPVDDSLSFKNFGAMRAEFLAFGDSTIRNRSAPRLVADEVDGYNWLGDVRPPLDIRRQTFGRQSMLLAMSHPDLARGLDPAKDWTSGIMGFYAPSDRRVWYWECPHCRAWSSPVPIASRVMTIEYPSEPDVPLDVVEREAYLLCPVGGCIVRDHERQDMNLSAYRSSFGGWIGLGQELTEGGVVKGELIPNDIAGFWIVGAMSPFVLGGIGGLAKERVKAERDLEASGEEQGLRQVMVKGWGVPYKRPKVAGSVDAKDIVARCEPELRKGFVPEGVRLLFAAVDIQKWGFEYLVRGYGPGGESWVVDHGRIAEGVGGAAISPATSPDDWDLMFSRVFRAYPLADGSGRVMALRGAGWDLHGEPGVSEQAYAAWLRWKARAGSEVRLYGQIDRREAWSHLPLRGANTLNAPRLIVTYPDTGKAATRVSLGAVPVAQHNPNVFKATVSGQLKRAEPGPGYIHFPTWLRSKEEPHVFFEQAVAERQLANGRWEKVTPGAKNEALDLLVMTAVLAHLHGVSRIDWIKPPPHAAPWNENPAVRVGEMLVPAPDAEADASAARTPAGAPPSPPRPLRTAEEERRARLAKLVDRMA